MEKIKGFIESDRGKDILTVLIVILVGLGSFGLGRLSKESGSAGLKIEYPDGLVSQAIDDQNAGTKTQTANVISATTPQTSSAGNFFASSKGSKYYPVGCQAGKSLKQENRIYFNSASEAETVGYELSSSCK